jgi:hypothetical protein
MGLKRRGSSSFDEALAERIRIALGPEVPVIEKKMFGGLAFMIHGHMTVGIVKQDLMVRVGPDGWESAMSQPHARAMDFTGRPLRGMVYVGPAATKRMPSLRKWVQRGLTFVKTLPPK